VVLLRARGDLRISQEPGHGSGQAHLPCDCVLSHSDHSLVFAAVSISSPSPRISSSGRVSSASSVTQSGVVKAEDTSGGMTDHFCGRRLHDLAALSASELTPKHFGRQAVSRRGRSTSRRRCLIPQAGRQRRGGLFQHLAGQQHRDGVAELGGSRHITTVCSMRATTSLA
jgi:hypothetical protein